MIQPVIFIPCYNAAETIVETVESVMEAIARTKRDIPVYIFDDCSNDPSISVLQALLKRFPTIHLIKNETNLGERRTTNSAAARLSDSHDWMFIIHADDIVKPDWLTTMIFYIEDQTANDFFTVWSSFDSLDHNTGAITSGDNGGGIQIKERSDEEINHYLVKLYSSWHISGAAVNLRHYRELRGFDEEMAQFGDTDFFVRGLKKGFKDLYISRTLTNYRIIQMSVSSVSVRTNRDIKEIYHLIRKYKHTLSRGDKKKMLMYCIKLTLNRSLKAFIKFRFGYASLQGQQMIHACKSYLAI